MIFELGIKHQGLKPYKPGSNDDPGLTLILFLIRSDLLTPNVFYEKMLEY